jgi:hypothetical protein
MNHFFEIFIKNIENKHKNTQNSPVQLKKITQKSYMLTVELGVPN